MNDKSWHCYASKTHPPNCPSRSRTLIPDHTTHFPGIFIWTFFFCNVSQPALFLQSFKSSSCLFSLLHVIHPLMPIGVCCCVWLCRSDQHFSNIAYPTFKWQFKLVRSMKMKNNCLLLFVNWLVNENN